jgi:hypothetical protein
MIPKDFKGKDALDELLEEKLFYVAELKKSFIITKKEINIFGRIRGIHRNHQ